MKKLIAAIIIILIIAGGCVIVYLQLTGPRMRTQPIYRHFQAIMPQISPNTIPVKDVFEPLPSKEQMQNVANPLEKTNENIASGKIYYDYYCVFCHGEKGDGFGPVGFSYVPVPADLRVAKVQNKSDGEILYLMLTGTGHSPVLEKIVLPQYRWYLVLYVRQLAVGSNMLSGVTVETDKDSRKINP